MLPKLFLIIYFISLTNSSFAQTYKIADSIFRANKHNLYLPAISKSYPQVELKSSYLIQKAYIEKNLFYDKISGYKSALTSKNSQNQYSADTPISGALFESGKSFSPSIINIADFRNMLIETELGFLIKKDIKEIIESQEALKKYISNVYPVIELPDIGFNDLKDINIIDLISINTGASNYILGKSINIDSIDINNINIKLFLDGKLISSGKSSQVMEGQSSVLLWLINDILSKGFQIKSGNILLTGSIGQINSSKPGLYLGDFGKLGNIFFEIK